MTTLSEAEYQALIVLIELTQPMTTPNNNFYTFYPHTADEAATYFRHMRTDWRVAYPSLQARGLLHHDEDASHGEKVALTPAGVAEAQRIRAARPPIWYWYKEYYAVAPSSPAYATFCAELYGKNLCQTNFSDMTQLQALLNVTQLGATNRVLDLGCGIGMITEYIADVTQATITGLDYIPDAIAQARARTLTKRIHLDFCVGNLDQLPFPRHAFDTLLAIDTLYMPNDLDGTLAQMHEILRPGGQMALFYSHMLWGEDEARATLEAAHTPLGVALRQAGLPYTTQDFSAATHAHLQRKHTIATSMRAAFAAEGHEFLYDYIMAESESDPTPYDPATSHMRRYLYHVMRN